MMTRILFLLFILLTGAVLTSQAQTSRDPAPVTNSRDNGVQREYFSPMPAEFFAPGEGEDSKKSRKRRKKKKKKSGYQFTYDKKIKEFEVRMKKVAKRYKKEEKLARKPQYSDPLYFGHKKPPKKRPVGKRKLCKECGIVH